MVPIGDPARLRRLAGWLSEQAEAVRGHARLVSARARAVRWESTAADAFRGQVDQEVSRLLASARGLDDASDALRRHARTVEVRLEEIGRIGHGLGAVLRRLGL
jgi:hypothetical protein